MRTRLSLSPRFSLVPALLTLNTALLVLLALAILAMPAPGIQTGFGGATVDIRADRAWVLSPGQYVNITWQLEGIKSLYIDGQGKVGTDEMTFCPGIDATSLNFEVTAANGEARTYFLKFHYLPAATVSSLALLALMLPFIIACYYFATMRLAESPISGLSPLLALAALLLVCLLMQTVLSFTIDDALNGLGNLFTSQSWYLFGWVVAGLVFIPLAIQSLWHRWRSGFREDFIVIGAFFALILLLYLPFGFDFVWHWEEWVFQAFLEGRASRADSEVTSRFWLLMLYPLANILDANPIIFYHHLHIFLATSKLVLLYAIVRKFGVAPLYAFLFTMLSMVYPVNTLLMSSRSVLYAFSMSALFAAVYLTLLFMDKPSRLRLLGILLALLFNVGSYENAYMIIVIAPILWFWRSPPLDQPQLQSDRDLVSHAGSEIDLSAHSCQCQSEILWRLATVQCARARALAPRSDKSLPGRGCKRVSSHLYPWMARSLQFPWSQCLACANVDRASVNSGRRGLSGAPLERRALSVTAKIESVDARWAVFHSARNCSPDVVRKPTRTNFFVSTYMCPSARQRSS